MAMTPFAYLRALVRNLRRPSAVEQQIDREIQSYLDLLVAEKVARGLAPEAARREALVELEGVEPVKEQVRAARAGAWIANVGRDIRYARRTLQRTPGFTAIAILTLALGIGATTAMFAVVNGVLLQPLPFSDAGRLMLVSYMPPPSQAVTRAQVRPGAALARMLTDRDYVEYAAHQRAFERIATYQSASRTITGAGDPARVTTAAVTTDFFGALRAVPAFGRAFTSRDADPGRDHVVILSDAIWRDRFGADRAALGRSIELDETPYTVIGVMPQGREFPHDATMWTPLAITIDPHLLAMRPVLGRLRPGVSPADARAELAALARNFPPMPNTNRARWQPDVEPLKELLVAMSRSSLDVFAAAVGVLLLIACANVAGLMLTRASARRHEMTIRAALGGSRARLLQQALVESMLLAIAGGAVGVLLSLLFVPAVVSMAPAGVLPRSEMIHVDGWTLAFTVIVSLVTGIAFGVGPAWRSTRRELSSQLGTRGRTVTASRDWSQRALVVAEVALALVLLTSAGLLLRSFLKLRATDPGFQADHVAAVTIDLPSAQYDTADRMKDTIGQMLQQLERLPDHPAIAAVSYLPLGDALIMGDAAPDASGTRAPVQVDKPSVSAGYFRSMGIRVLRGREFTPADSATSQPVAVLSASAAAAFWPHTDPIGRTITLEDKPKPSDWLTIVGVVDDVRQQTLGHAVDAAVYRPYTQVAQPFFLVRMTYLVRSAGDPAHVVPDMRAVVAAVDPRLPGEYTTLPELLSNTTAEPRFQARLIGVFAIVALALAIVGIYGILSHSVSTRTREIGIRVALGARPVDVLRLVLGQTLALSLSGIAIGAIGAAIVTRSLAEFLFGVTPHDPGTLMGVGLLVLGAALVTAVAPARRAKRVDPVIALRAE